MDVCIRTHSRMTERETKTRISNGTCALVTLTHAVSGVFQNSWPPRKEKKRKKKTGNETIMCQFMGCPS